MWKRTYIHTVIDSVHCRVLGLKGMVNIARLCNKLCSTISTLDHTTQLYGTLDHTTQLYGTLEHTTQLYGTL